MEKGKRFYLNIILAVLVFGAWLLMVFYGGGELTNRGLASLKYFTVQSNLLAGVAAALWLIFRNRENSRWTEVLKFVAAETVFLTFTIVLLFLGPLYGLLGMYQGANLFLHLICPLIAIYEFIFLSKTEITRRERLLTIIPTIVYGIGYLANIFINGIGKWPETNDWYGFLNWGYPVGMIIFAVIALISWLLGLLMLKLRNSFAGRNKN